MIDQGLRAKRSLAPAHRGRELFGAIAVVVAATVGIIAVAQAGGNSDDAAAGAALVADSGASGSNDPTVAAATDVVDTKVAGTSDTAT